MLKTQTLESRLRRDGHHEQADRLARWLKGLPGGSVVIDTPRGPQAFPDLITAEEELDRQENESP